MKLFLAFMLTFSCALSGAKYQSDLHINMQAAFFEEAERAYRDIIAYDENAPVTREEIHALYAHDACLAPIRKKIAGIINKIDSMKPKTAAEYAEECLFAGEILESPPDGIIFVRCYLLPFSPEETKIYDQIQKSGEIHALDALFSQLEDYVLRLNGAFTPDNGFEPYFKMKDDGAVIPVYKGARYLTDKAVSAALSVSESSPVSPPVRDARGMIVFEFVSD